MAVLLSGLRLKLDHEKYLLQTVLARRRHDTSKTMALQTLPCGGVIEFGNESVVRGPFCYHDFILVCEGYRVGKNMRRWAESLNNGEEACRERQKGFLRS